jgi:hypothetical protein
MAYSANKEPDELTALTTLDSGDVFVVGDISDASEVAKYITKSNLITDLSASFAAVLGADDNYVTDAEKVKLTNLSGTNTGDQTSIVGITGTIAQFNTAVTDADFATLAGAESLTNKKLGSLTSNGFVKTSAGDGTLSVDTSTYITSSSISDTAYGAGWNGDTTVAPSKNAVYDEMELRAPKASPTFTGTVTLPVALTGVIRADSGVVSVDSDVTDIVSAASDVAAGKIEVATTAETNTGTDTGRAVSPDGLAGSYAGTKSLSVQVFDGATDVTTGDGKAYITIPEALNGMNLVRAQATVVTAGTTNATTVMIHNKTDTQDMLSGAASIASGGTVGTVGTVNGSFDDVATNDVLRIDVDSVSTTAPKGLMVVLEFRLA